MACHLLMDCAYEGNETRQLALDLGFIPVVPPNPWRLEPWRLKKALYGRRNEIERLFRRLKGFRGIFTSGHLKDHELTNRCAGDFAHLKSGARNRLRAMQRPPSLIRAVWHQVEVPRRIRNAYMQV